MNPGVVNVVASYWSLSIFIEHGPPFARWLLFSKEYTNWRAFLAFCFTRVCWSWLRLSVLLKGKRNVSTAVVAYTKHMFFVHFFVLIWRIMSCCRCTLHAWLYLEVIRLVMASTCCLCFSAFCSLQVSLVYLVIFFYEVVNWTHNIWWFFDMNFNLGNICTVVRTCVHYQQQCLLVSCDKVT